MEFDPHVASFVSNFCIRIRGAIVQELREVVGRVFGGIGLL